MANNSFDVIIVGAGAAGLMCAIHASYRGRKVLVIEKSKKAGRKILMSGGGRCNFTNLNTSVKNFLSENPSFCLSALKRYTPQDFVDWVDRHGIEYHEKAPGQLFCNDSSADIVNLLLTEVEWSGVEILYDTVIDDIHITSQDKPKVLSSRGTFTCDSVVIATGGLSIPSMGSSSFGYDIAKSFGLRVVEPRAGLVPLTLSAQDKEILIDLAGVSLPVEVSLNDIRFIEPMLVTHRGLSGPAMLQISNYWKPGDTISIQLVDSDFASQLKKLRSEKPRMNIENFLSSYLPKRFASLWCGLNQLSSPLQEYSNKDIEQIHLKLQQWKVSPAGTEGYKTAEVTLGGVDTTALSSKTFSVKEIPQLFFIGEVLDVTGQLGGYNFQWAWSSGFCAAQYV